MDFPYRAVAAAHAQCDKTRASQQHGPDIGFGNGHGLKRAAITAAKQAGDITLVKKTVTGAVRQQDVYGQGIAANELRVGLVNVALVESVSFITLLPGSKLAPPIARLRVTVVPTACDGLLRLNIYGSLNGYLADAELNKSPMLTARPPRFPRYPGSTAKAA